MSRPEMQKPKIAERAAQARVQPHELISASESRSGFRLSPRIVCDLVSIVDFFGIVAGAYLIAEFARRIGAMPAALDHNLETLVPLFAFGAALALRAAGLCELQTLIQVSRQASRLPSPARMQAATRGLPTLLRQPSITCFVSEARAETAAKHTRAAVATRTKIIKWAPPFEAAQHCCV